MKSWSSKPLPSGHYDSVPTSFGASHDGLGISVMLETLRTLKARVELRNDVVLLFSDGEEIGLLGAKAFFCKEWGIAVC